MLGVPPSLCLHIEVKSIYEATRSLARNVSPSWRVTLGFLFLFCRSYSGQCTSSGRPPTHRRCSCWRGASPWTYTRCCSVTGRETKQMVFENADCSKAETKQRWRELISFGGGILSLYIVRCDYYQTIALFLTTGLLYSSCSSQRFAQKCDCEMMNDESGAGLRTPCSLTVLFTQTMWKNS